MNTKLFNFIYAVGLAVCTLSCNSDPVGLIKDDIKTTDTYAMGQSSDELTDSIPKPGEPYIPNPDSPDYTEGENPEIIYPPKLYPGEPGFPDGEPGIPPPPPLPSLELVLSVDDIKSYNIETMEIVFSDLIVKKLSMPNDEGHYDSSVLYYNGNPLFEDIKIMWPTSSNPWRGFIVLSIGLVGYDELLNKYDYKFYLVKNTQEYQTKWDIFIKYLIDVGKIVR